MSAITTIDPKFRPKDYFWAQKLGIPLASDIKGANRRRLYLELLDASSTDGVQAILARSALSESDRQFIGRIHPSFMGGEYLPDTASTEVEIARIVIASTSRDVISVYAKKTGGRYRYRVVDEYGGDTLGGVTERTSMQPLTLKSLTDFFLRAWDLMDVLESNFMYENYPRAAVHDFVLSADSDFYPDFGALVACRIDAWLDTVIEEDDEEDERDPTGRDIPMGKVLKGRSAKPDDPIFSGGVGIFSVHTTPPDPMQAGINAYEQAGLDMCADSSGTTRAADSALPDPMQPAIDAYEKAMVDMLTDKPEADPMQPAIDAYEKQAIELAPGNPGVDPMQPAIDAMERTMNDLAADKPELDDAASARDIQMHRKK